MSLLRDSRSRGAKALVNLYHYNRTIPSLRTTKSPFSSCTKCNILFREPRPVTDKLLKLRKEPVGVPIPLYQNLVDRGFIENISGDRNKFAQFLDGQRTAAYAGIDPTADAIHVGNLMVLMPLVHLYLHGHRAITVIGSGTVVLGDPSGRSTEREKRNEHRLERAGREDSMKDNIKRFWKRVESRAKELEYDMEDCGRRDLMNNREWLQQVSIQEFFTLVGRHARIGTMLAKDSVKLRMESSEGMSYSEFSYSLLQAYDFWQLYNQKLCRIQIGGSDQWGNITAGLDLIKKQILEYADPGQFEQAYGWTVPLLTTSSGEKFGKSAGNAIWLDEKKTSPFELYQFFIRTDDAVVEQYLKFFTLLRLPDIASTMEEHTADPTKRLAQRKLATEVVSFIHGSSAARSANIQSEILYPQPGETVLANFATIQHEFKSSQDLYIYLPRDAVLGNLLSKVAYAADLTANRTIAHNLIKGGGLYYGLENLKITDPMAVVTEEMLIEGKFLILRAGMKKIRMVELTDADSVLSEEEAKMERFMERKGKLAQQKKAKEVGQIPVPRVRPVSMLGRARTDGQGGGWGYRD